MVDMVITGVKVVAVKAVDGGDDAELPTSSFTVDDLAMNTTRIGCAE
jgi:hypothetical protein